MTGDHAASAPIRIAVLSKEISHFEAPLFRLMASDSQLAVLVLYLEPVQRQRFDAGYALEIDWGDDLLAGYDAQRQDNVAAMLRTASRWNADVLLYYGYSWRGAAFMIVRNWLRGMPQVHRGTLHYSLDPRTNPLKARILRPLRNGLLRMFDAHHVGGEYSRRALLEAGVSANELFFVPYSVDSRYFAQQADSYDRQLGAQALRTQLGWAEDDHVLLFVAQHNWIKGPDIAMSAFAAVAERDAKARLLVVGSGRMTEEMQARAARMQHPAHVHFAGFIPSLQTVPYYLASDLVLCTSRFETWARMTNEAMLCRRPCLVSRAVAAAGGLVEDGVTGAVVDAADPAQFATAIERFFSLDRQTREAMGQAARARALHFSYEPHVGNVVAAAHHAMKARGRFA